MSKEIQIKKRMAQPIADDKISKVYIGTHVVEAITVQNKSRGIHNYKKVCKDGCVNLLTGEYVPYKAEKKSTHIQNHFKKSVNDLRRIINCNFFGNNSEKFLTLTYNYPMTDYKIANDDFRKFWSLFKYRFPSCEYIRILEPQENGNWHIHVLITDRSYNNLFLGVDLIKSMWNKGRVWVENLPYVDNFGAYFSVQFSTMEKSSISSKAYKKGSRIKLYPPNFKLYTCSKGIRKPKATNMIHEELMIFVGHQKPCYSYTNSIIKDDKEINSITYEQFLI